VAHPAHHRLTSTLLKDMEMDPYDERAFQDDLAAIGFEHCWGCGAANRHGLHVKSYWSPDSADEAICVWQPQPYHIAAPGIVSGGIIATLIDCHSAAACRAEGRSITSDPPLPYLTAALQVSYLRPTPSDGPVTLRARVSQTSGRKTTVTCSLYSAEGVECACGEVVAVRVPTTAVPAS
jgi:acyl-coenzyme A thioesterase PaaI-like protein